LTLNHLQSVSAIALAADISGSTFAWTNSNTSIGLAASGTGNIPAFTATNTTSSPITGNITVTPKSVEGCEGVPKALTITVFNITTLDVNLGSDTTICWADSLKLNAKHPQATSYCWQDGSTEVTYTVYRDNDGEYWVFVKGRCDSEASDTINVSFQTNIVLHDTTHCINNLTDKKLDVTNPHASYEWQDGSTSPVYIVEETGVYRVTVSNACISATAEINVIDCTVDFTLPNIFTPNGDGINDTFSPEFTSPSIVSDFQMYIYDRWGRLVFVTDNLLTPWSGCNKNGKPYAEGVYYCVLSFKGPLDKEQQTYHTSVTLKR
jgi:gliding motility-associated-like protein